jgi:hypothetical protein
VHYVHAFIFGEEVPTSRRAALLSSQNRPRIGRGNRDVARVRGAPQGIGAPAANLFV